MTKEYKAKYLKEYKEPTFNTDKVAGINSPLIKEDIAIQP